MKYLLILSLFLCLSLTGCGQKKENNSQNYSASRTSTNTAFNNQTNEATKSNQTIDIESKEENLSSFSTKIYTPNDEARQTNITITCSKLNGKIIKPGETFSFCNTVGKATPEAGYKKADVFDKNGNTIKAYGGGNCQISSTIYNAVLALPSIKIIERHQHSKEVYYVPLGKDAAVAYGSVDFKFRNDYDYSIKIYCSNTRDSINVRIVKT